MTSDSMSVETRRVQWRESLQRRLRTGRGIPASGIRHCAWTLVEARRKAEAAGRPESLDALGALIDTEAARVAEMAQDAVARIDEEARRAHYLGGVDVTEIATELGIPDSQARGYVLDGGPYSFPALSKSACRHCGVVIDMGEPIHTCAVLRGPWCSIECLRGAIARSLT